MERRYNLVTVIGRTACIVLQTAGGFGILAPAYYIIEGLTPGLMTVLSAKMFDQAAAYAEGQKEARKLWYFLAVIVTVYIVKEMIKGVGSIATNASIYERCPAVLKQKLAEKFTRLSLIDYEKPQIHDMCQRAKDCIVRDKLSAVFMVSTVIFTNMAGLAVTLAVVASYHILLLPVSFVSVFPYLITQKLGSNALYDMEKGHAGMERRAGYLWRLLTGGESEKELHINDAIEYVSGQWRAVNHRMQTQKYRFQCKMAGYHMICMALQTLGMGASIGITAVLMIRGRISVGEFGACIVAFGALQTSAGTFLAELGRMGEHLSFAADFFRFMDLPEEKPLLCLERVPEEIVLHKVSFTYPSAERKAICEISLSIKEGRQIALVGENGCGKSTLIKLITGVFEPDEGEILLHINGKTERNANISRNISVVLQDFTRYYLTLRENVAISDIDHMEDRERIRECLQKINAPTKPLDGRMGASFGGQEYSGGQWQRIAIARGIFRDREFFVLDEPTSALDPMAETEILKLFLEIMKGSTSIIVSHRIGLCRYVDEVVVMKQGRIAETGSHEELLAGKGEYFRMYEEQSRWYRRE